MLHVKQARIICTVQVYDSCNIVFNLLVVFDEVYYMYQSLGPLRQG